FRVQRRPSGKVQTVTRPTRAELLAAYGTTIPDLAGPNMRVLLVGINPSLWSGWAGVHFARPSNRLWRTLHESGLTDRLLHPSGINAHYQQPDLTAAYAELRAALPAE